MAGLKLYSSNSPLAGNNPGGSDCIIQLQKNYRFGQKSGIGAVSRAVNKGDSKSSMMLLKEGAFQDIQWQELPRLDALPRALRDRIVNGYAGYLRATETGEIFNLFPGSGFSVPFGKVPMAFMP
jgi:exodeoxyribonuclease V alpha subunit